MRLTIMLPPTIMLLTQATAFARVISVTVVVRILVAMDDNLVSLLFPAWTSRVRRV